MHGPTRPLVWLTAAGAILLLVASGRADLVDGLVGRWGPESAWWAVTISGNTRVLAGVALVAAAYLWVEGRRAESAWLVTLWAVAVSLTQVLKDLLDRPRPDGGAFYVDSEAFPSGHALVGLTVYGAWALLAVPGRRGAWWLAAAWGLVLGVSRLALGLHYLTDVLAGWCLAMALLALMQVTRRSSTRPGPDAGRPPA